MIGLFLLVVPYSLRNLRSMKLRPEWLPLLMICFGLTLYAISNNITVGSKSLYVALPETITNPAGILRAGARMFWPVYYMIYWGLIVLLLKAYRHRTAIILVAFVLLTQTVDTSAGWLTRRVTDAGSAWHPRLTSPEWDEILTNYKKIRVFEPGRVGSPYKDIAYLAATRNLPTDSAYLARLDHGKYENLFRVHSTRHSVTQLR